MQNFQGYPLSPCYSVHSPKEGRFLQSFPRFTSNDSGISFGESDNESTLSDECELELDYKQSITIADDVHMASKIDDNEKKLFCENTAWAWHGEFGRLIMAKAMAHNVDYRLMLYDAQSACPRALNARYSMIKSDNAKAQFKCQRCGHSWTSMRARCSFYISKPHEGGIVLLKLYNQQCQYCYSTVDPLWYYDEICRVMKNLAFTIFEHFFLPQSFHSIQWDLTHNGLQPVRRLIQRKGLMCNRHNPSLCEACRVGFCYQ